MKKVLALAAIMLLSIGAMTVQAQNKFKGIVKYNIASTGEVPVKITDEIATAEVKVMGDQVATSSQILLGSPFTNTAIANGRTVTTCYDFSMLIAALASQGMEFENYSGDGKIIYKHTYTQEEIDSVTIPVTEGYYIEYVAGETKKIAGYTAKKAIFHIFNNEGEDNQRIFWYCDEIGPAENLIFQGLKGMPLEYSLTVGEGQELTMTATEIKTGKVKDADFYRPAGFKELSKDELKAFFEEFQEIMELLSE